jgi:hypothetical protein
LKGALLGKALLLNGRPGGPEWTRMHMKQNWKGSHAMIAMLPSSPGIDTGAEILQSQEVENRLKIRKRHFSIWNRETTLDHRM